MARRFFRSGLLLTAAAGLLAAQGFRERMAVEVDGPGDSSRSRPFVNHATLFRACTRLEGSGSAPVDGGGWPVSDARCVMFDVRPIPAWAPPIDDPRQFQPDWSGNWNLALEGRAEITVSSGGGRVNNLKYDEATNTTAAEIAVTRGNGLIVLDFKNTRRAPDAALNSGFRGLRFVRPNYPAASGQIFTDEFLRSFAPFRAIRYMDWTDTNGNTPSSDPRDRLEWSDRHLIADATQQRTGRKSGAAWEYAILLANQTGTDMWINIPVAASDDYVRQLARLIAAKLNRSLRVYIEHGNEVWNPLFANSYQFNRNSAAAEVAAGGSKLASDGTTSQDALAVRRHLRRLTEAVAIFREEMPETAKNARIRGVFAWWTIYPDRYLGALNWFKTNYGEPKESVYGLAQTHYYNVSRAGASASPEELLAAMQQSSDNGIRSSDEALSRTARDFGLQHLVYEGGPDVGGGSTANVGNRIEANRLPGMKDLVIRDMKTNFFDRGGAEYVYFSHCGSCSRYGCWGATEDIVDQDTPKLQALRELAAMPVAVRVTSVGNAASGSADLSPGSFVTLRGSDLASGTWLWHEAILDGSRALPTMLGGVQVRAGGRTAAVQYASPAQINAVLPPDLPAGPVELEVTTRNGTYRGSVNLKPAAPGIFTYVAGSTAYAAAVFAGTGVFVAAPGRLSGIASRPGRAGDYVELYVTGLGATADPYPANENPVRPYPVAGSTRVRVTVGGRDAAVLFAGLTQAGVFQVNIQVPAGAGAGDQPVVVWADAAASQTAQVTLGQ